MAGGHCTGLINAAYIEKIFSSHGEVQSLMKKKPAHCSIHQLIIFHQASVGFVPDYIETIVGHFSNVSV